MHWCTKLQKEILLYLQTTGRYSIFWIFFTKRKLFLTKKLVSVSATTITNLTGQLPSMDYVTLSWQIHVFYYFPIIILRAVHFVLKYIGRRNRQVILVLMSTKGLVSCKKQGFFHSLLDDLNSKLTRLICGIYWAAFLICRIAMSFCVLMFYFF